MNTMINGRNIMGENTVAMTREQCVQIKET